MNERSNDRFDSLISAAVVDCVYQTADEFCAVDTSAVPSTPRLYKKVMRNLPGRKRTTVKVILVAALVAAFVALTACACITEIREYVWGVVTEWYGDHFEVSFEKDFFSNEQETTDPEFTFPSMIEDKAVLRYLPNGSVLGDETLMLSQCHTNYYLESGDWLFIFSQYVILDNGAYLDAEHSNAIKVFVNDNEGILIESNDANDVSYYLIWQDSYYRYSISGKFRSLSDLLKVAESLELTPIPQ